MKEGWCWGPPRVLRYGVSDWGIPHRTNAVRVRDRNQPTAGSFRTTPGEGPTDAVPELPSSPQLLREGVSLPRTGTAPSIQFSTRMPHPQRNVSGHVRADDSIRSGSSRSMSSSVFNSDIGQANAGRSGTVAMDDDGMPSRHTNGGVRRAGTACTARRSIREMANLSAGQPGPTSNEDSGLRRATVSELAQGAVFRKGADVLDPQAECGDTGCQVRHGNGCGG